MLVNAVHGCIVCTKCGFPCPLCKICNCYKRRKEMNNTNEIIGIDENYYIGDPLPDQPAVNYLQTSLDVNSWSYCCCRLKSPREKVQEEILTKMADAIESDDLKKARELVKLAKALKEL